MPSSGSFALRAQAGEDARPTHAPPSPILRTGEGKERGFFSLSRALHGRGWFPVVQSAAGNRVMGAGGLLGLRQHIDAAGRAQRRDSAGQCIKHQ